MEAITAGRQRLLPAPDLLTAWIRRWAGAAATGGKQIELKEPVIKEVGASKNRSR